MGDDETAESIETLCDFPQGVNEENQEKYFIHEEIPEDEEIKKKSETSEKDAPEEIKSFPPLGTVSGRAQLKEALQNQQKLKLFQQENCIEKQIESTSAGLKLLDILKIERNTLYLELFKYIKDAFLSKIRRCNHANEVTSLLEEIFPFVYITELRPLVVAVLQHEKLNKIPSPIIVKITE